MRQLETIYDNLSDLVGIIKLIRLVGLNDVIDLRGLVDLINIIDLFDLSDLIVLIGVVDLPHEGREDIAGVAFFSDNLGKFKTI